ncbi:MAG: DUF2490 domain-containing protein [Bacteroidales bacterium]|nr:DUF2490 domain-containing protein [Bacteroidales bacterium]
MIRVIVILVFSVLIVNLQAQNKAYLSGFAPEITLNKKISKKVSLTSKIESIHYYYSNENGNGYLTPWSHKGIDFQFFGNYKLSPFYRISMGYQLSYNPAGKPSNRLIEQLSYSGKLGSMKLGHRVRADQTFYSSGPAKFRFRYRFSLQIPLQGSSVDVGEFFMIASDELILTAKSGSSSLENRTVAQIGFRAMEKMDVQAGFDFRAEGSKTMEESQSLMKIALILDL